MTIYKTTYYAVSNDRLIIAQNAFGKSVDIINLIDIDEINLKKTAFDRIFNTGTICIQKLQKEDDFRDIEVFELISVDNYLNTYKFLKKLIIGRKKLREKEEQSVNFETMIEQKSVS
jgi:hypothetical protein